MRSNPFLQWLSRETNSVYWNDTAHYPDQQEGAYNGAVGMTTNPVLCAATLSKDKDFWTRQLAGVSNGLGGNDKVVEIIKGITCFYANMLKPIYDEHGASGKGYVCAQVNPSDIGNADRMLEQAKQYATWAPNIVIKLPATRAGIEVQEECVSLGYNVASTLSFSVPQIIEAAKAHQRGRKKAVANGIKPGLAIAVLMVGRLDDYLRDVVHDARLPVEEGDIISAGTACIKHAYDIFQQEKWETYLMPAGCRGAYHITDLAGAKMIMSINPKISKLLESVDVFKEKFSEPVEKGILKRLNSVPEFRKAYEPDGMSLDDFIAYGPTNRTLAQFVESGWNSIMNFAP